MALFAGCSRRGARAQAARRPTVQHVIALEYPLESGEFNVPETSSVSADIGSGSISGGTQVTINKIRLDWTCNAESARHRPHPRRHSFSTRAIRR